MQKQIKNYDVLSIYRYLPIFILLLLVILFYFPIIFEGKTFYPFDCLFSYLPWSTYSQGFYPQNPLITDPINAIYPSNFYPIHFYYQEALKTGSFSLWLNSIFSGIPFIYYAYPLHYLFFSFLPITLAHDIFLFIHLFGTGVFTYFYLKKIGLSRFPSTIGAIAWMFNGYVMVWFEFEHVPMLAMTLSATLLCIELWKEKRSKLRFLCLVLAISLTICTSYAHLIIYQLLFVGAYTLFRFWTCVNEKRIGLKNNLKMLFGISSAMLVSVIISTHFFTSHLLLLKSSQRKSIPYNELFKKTGQLPGKYLFTMLFPDLFGSPSSKASTKFKGLTPSFTPKTYKTQAYNNYNELCVYAGIFPTLLALFCVLHFRNNTFILFFFISSCVCLLMAMGNIIYYPLAKFIPGLNLSTPTRILYLFGFSICILSALGAQILKENKSDKQIYATIFWLTILILSIALITYLQTEEGRKWLIGPYYLSKWKNHPNADKIIRLYLSVSSNIIVKPILSIVSALIILFGLLYIKDTHYKNILFACGILLLSYDLISFGRIYNTTSPKYMEFPKTPAIQFLKRDTEKYRVMTFGDFLPNSLIPYNIENIGGYGSFYPKRYGEYLYESQFGPTTNLAHSLSRWIVFQKIGSPLLDVLNTKYILTDTTINIKSSKLKLVYDSEIKIYKNLQAFPRIFFVTKYEFADSPEDALNKVGRCSREDFRKKVILESIPSKKMDGVYNNNETENLISDIKILSYSKDMIKLEVSSNSDGFIVISDNYYPGWIASIDGEKTEILKANYIMRSIAVRSGKHTVTFEFKPMLLIGGYYITIFGWLTWFAIMLWIISKWAYFKLTCYREKIKEKKSSDSD